MSNLSIIIKSQDQKMAKNKKAKKMSQLKMKYLSRIPKMIE
jgi:hypothetical protein